MTDVRRLMGRLNAATANYEGTRGGKPELTAQDIAGALASIEDELAREVFCACWWEAGARLTRDYLMRLIGFRQFAEFDAQMKRVQRARLELHIALDGIAARGNKQTQFEKDITHRLKQKLEDAKKKCWPAQAPMYSKIREAVLNEVASPNHCRECGGRGEMSAGELIIRCRQCDGSGTSAVSDRQRAARIGRDPKTYREEWKPLYEWTYDLVRDAEADAIKAMKKALQ